jgi:predicted nucleic-acid-binding protein
MSASGMRAVDTNVVVRLLMRDNAEQTSAAERFIEAGAWVPILALAETVWVLESVYGFGAKDLITAVEMLLDHDKLVLQYSDAVAASRDMFRAQPTLDFMDCLILELARAAGHGPLGTFDRKLGRIAGAQKL